MLVLTPATRRESARGLLAARLVSLGREPAEAKAVAERLELGFLGDKEDWPGYLSRFRLAYMELKPAPVRPSDKPRAQMRRKFQGVIELAGGFEGVEQLATTLESACYNAFIRDCCTNDEVLSRRWDSQHFLQGYSLRCSTVLSAFDPDAPYHSVAVARLRRGEVTARELGSMDASELVPEASAEVRKKLALRSRQETVETKRTVRMFKCGRCGQSRCTYYLVQTRSADEPPTIKITCEVCGNCWSAEG